MAAPLELESKLIDVSVNIVCDSDTSLKMTDGREFIMVPKALAEQLEALLKSYGVLYETPDYDEDGYEIDGTGYLCRAS